MPRAGRHDNEIRDNSFQEEIGVLVLPERIENRKYDSHEKTCLQGITGESAVRVSFRRWSPGRVQHANEFAQCKAEYLRVKPRPMSRIVYLVSDFLPAEQVAEMAGRVSRRVASLFRSDSANRAYTYPALSRTVHRGYSSSRISPRPRSR